MGDFYHATKQKKIIKLLQSFNFTFKQSSKHIKAYCPKTGQWTTIPRHTELKSGTTKSICDFLVSLGYDQKQIEAAIK